MVIKKLNALFHRHSRWLFGAITIVIIVSFMGFLTPGGFGCNVTGPDAIEVGRALGEPVTYGQLRDTQRKLQVAFELLYNTSMRELQPEQLFGYQCMLIKAGKLGISAGDKEVAERIRQMPNFQTAGKFDMEKYTKQIGALGRYGVTEKDVYDALRMIAVMEKLQTELASGIIATPGEAEELFRQANTNYEARVAQFALPGIAFDDKADFTKLAKEDQGKLVDFFKKNRERYTIEGNLSALLVGFPYADFKAQATREATPAALEQFYKANQSRFADKAGKVRPYDQVKGEVAKEFVADAARLMAVTAADDFATKAGEEVASAEQTAVRVKSFRAAADKLKKVVVETGKVLFSATEAGGVKSPEVVRALVAVAGNPVTPVVAADQAAYVGFVLNRVETRPAKLEEITPRALHDMRQADALTAARKSVGEQYAKLSKLPASGQAAAFNALPAKISDLKFSAMNQPKPEMGDAAMAALNLRPGESAPVVPALQIVRLEKRVPADMKSFKGQESRYEMMVKMQKMERAMATFQEELNSQCRFNSAALNR